MKLWSRSILPDSEFSEKNEKKQEKSRHACLESFHIVSLLSVFDEITTGDKNANLMINQKVKKISFKMLNNGWWNMFINTFINFSKLSQSINTQIKRLWQLFFLFPILKHDKYLHCLSV